MSEKSYTTKEMLKLAEGKGHAPSVEHADEIKAAFRQCLADRAELAEEMLCLNRNGIITIDEDGERGEVKRLESWRVKP